MIAANKTLIKVIEKGVLVGTYFRHIYFSVNGKWYKKSRKEFAESAVLLFKLL